MNSGFWMAKGTGCLADSEMNYDNNSRLEPKRAHQWFMDGPEAELFPNKKQAVEVPNNNLFSGMLNSNLSPWGNASSFQSFSGHFTERLFDSEGGRTVNYDDRSIPSVNTGKLDIVRKDMDDPFGNDSSFGLSMAHTMDDPRLGLNFGGIRKVKVSQVKEPESLMVMGHAYNRGDNNTLLTSHGFNKADDNSISMGLTYNKGDDNIISIDSYDRDNTNFISMGQPYNKGDDSISLDPTYKENSNIVSMGHVFRKGDDNIISMGQAYNKADESTISMGHMYSKGEDSSISLGNTYNKVDNSNLSMGHSYNKGDGSTIISFGGYNDDDDTNPSGRLICNYDMLLSQQPSVRRSEPVNSDKEKSNADALVSASQISATGIENTSRKKDELKMSKKAPSNNFPSNVRSLLSTGMLDGVPVKYIAWSREELCGVIKGSGYLCGCSSCNLSKVINAYEFERHAGCKTKHPNNHIYFENGKTIYGIVQELRSTSQSMLFDVIQTITGSPINQKSFRLWKESFLAATRELQRIYGKDEGKQLS